MGRENQRGWPYAAPVRRLCLVSALALASVVSASAPMNAQTCARPACVGPVASADALLGPASRAAREWSWRAAGRRGAPPRVRRPQARWAVPPATLAGGPAARVGVLALEGLPGSRRPGASAWLALERADGWHACEAASRAGSRRAVRVDADAPALTRLFEQGAPGVTVALHFSESWRTRAFDYFVWHDHVAACDLDGDAPTCFGSIEIESGTSESDGEGSERTIETVRARFDGQGHVDVEAVRGQDSIPAGEPSLFDQVGRHDVRSLRCRPAP